MSHATIEHVASPAEPLYGLLADFDDAAALLAAVRRTREAGYRDMSAYTPFPVEGLADALQLPPTRLPWLVLAGGMLGGATAYGMQYYASVISYPLNVGGRPLDSWPSFIPITFELTVLGAAFAAIFGMLALNGLPHPHHPLFNVPEFKLASRSRFFLCVRRADPQFDFAATRQFLESLPAKVYEVPL